MDFSRNAGEKGARVGLKGADTHTQIIKRMKIEQFRMVTHLFYILFFFLHQFTSTLEFTSLGIKNTPKHV